MNTIGNMQNEKYFYGHYNMFENNHGFEKVKMQYWNANTFI